MTRRPLFKFLRAPKSKRPLHSWIRAFYMIWRLFYHLNARGVFPKRIPTMRGQKKGQVINDRVEAERQNLITEAAKKPISMLVDSPDPHGESVYSLVICCLHKLKYLLTLFCRCRWYHRHGQYGTRIFWS